MEKETIIVELAQIRQKIDQLERHALVALAIHDDQAEAYLAYEEIKHLTVTQRELENQLAN